MEDLVQRYHFLACCVEELEAGTSLNRFVEKYAQKRSSGVLQLVQLWQVNAKRGTLIHFYRKKQPHYHDKMMLKLFERSAQGHQILSALKELLNSVHEEIHHQIDNYVTQLPYKLMIPLLLFQFPALMVLFIGPLLMELMKGL